MVRSTTSFAVAMDPGCNVRGDEWFRASWILKPVFPPSVGATPETGSLTSVPEDGGPNQQLDLSIPLARRLLRPADPAELERPGRC